MLFGIFSMRFAFCGIQFGFYLRVMGFSYVPLGPMESSLMFIWIFLISVGSLVVLYLYDPPWELFWMKLCFLV